MKILAVLNSSQQEWTPEMVQKIRCNSKKILSVVFFKQVMLNHGRGKATGNEAIQPEAVQLQLKENILYGVVI